MSSGVVQFYSCLLIAKVCVVSTVERTNDLQQIRNRDDCIHREYGHARRRVCLNSENDKLDSLKSM